LNEDQYAFGTRWPPLPAERVLSRGASAIRGDGGQTPRDRGQLVSAQQSVRAEGGGQTRADGGHQRRSAGREHALDGAGRDARSIEGFPHRPVDGRQVLGDPGVEVGARHVGREGSSGVVEREGGRGAGGRARLLASMD